MHDHGSVWTYLFGPEAATAQRVRALGPGCKLVTFMGHGSAAEHADLVFRVPVENPSNPIPHKAVLGELGEFFIRGASSPT